MRTPPRRELIEPFRNVQCASKAAIASLGVVLVHAAIVRWRVVMSLHAHERWSTSGLEAFRRYDYKVLRWIST
jgi:hypothetical protein